MNWNKIRLFVWASGAGVYESGMVASLITRHATAFLVSSSLFGLMTFVYSRVYDQLHSGE